MKIPFNKPYIVGTELDYIKEACAQGQLNGDGPFTKKCEAWLEKYTGAKKVYLTQSCTSALDMTALLLDLKPGDEVIIPTYTFVSGANAFALRGAMPVFVDMRRDTMNIDASQIESAITPKTKVIAPMHYAGVGCDMDAIMDIAKRHNLFVVEDAAQTMLASYKNKPLGTFGNLGTLSFHGTKNVTSGEGGALIINDESLLERAAIIREKGTDRRKFLLGQIDKYGWVDIGSSFLPSEITAAFLLAQLEHAEEITKKRLEIWHAYHDGLKELEDEGLIQRMSVPAECQANAHIYYMLLKDFVTRNLFRDKMSEAGIGTTTHYIPLHKTTGGKKFGRNHGDLSVAEELEDRMVRLPLYPEVADQIPYIIETIKKIVRS